MASGGRRRGALEQEVLSCLAAAQRPMAVADVQTELGGGLAYTTIMTALSRLHAKGALSRQSTGRAYVYTLSSDPAAVHMSMTARRMSRLLDSGPDRAGVLARFVADLSPEDERLLSDLLADDRRTKRDGG